MYVAKIQSPLLYLPSHPEADSVLEERVVIGEHGKTDSRVQHRQLPIAVGARAVVLLATPRISLQIRRIMPFLPEMPIPW